MNTKIRRLLGLIALPVAVALLTPTEAPAQEIKRGDYYLPGLTGPSRGIYFPIGGEFSNLIGLLGYLASATATGGTA